MPLSWIMGVPWEHCEDVATLIGLKVVANELIAYQRMGEFKEQGRLYGRSEVIATFAICGFANPGSIGITIGCLTSLAPEKKKEITTTVMRAFFAGSAVCLLTASIAGKAEILNIRLPPSFKSSVSGVTDQAATLSAGILVTDVPFSSPTTTIAPNTSAAMALSFFGIPNTTRIN